MKKLYEYIRDFHQYLNKNFNHFGKPVKGITLEKIEKGGYVTGNGVAYRLNDLGEDVIEKIVPYDEYTIVIAKDEIDMVANLDTTSLVIKRNYEGRESVQLVKNIPIDKIFKGKVMWDGDEFFGLDKDGKELARYLNEKSEKLPYIATFNFNEGKIEVVKNLKNNSDLKEELKEFNDKLTEYENFLEKVLYNYRY